MHEVEVGWLIAADVTGGPWRSLYARARDRLQQELQQQFPEFEWRMPISERRIHLPVGALDPLELLELGGDEKLHRGWDAALVLVPNELLARHQIAALAVPSSALEVAVISSSRLGEGEGAASRIVALAQHVLGHLWGLEHAEAGPMRPVDDPESLEPAPYAGGEAELLRETLRSVSAPRLEEGRRRWSSLSFYLATARSEAGSIARDIWGVHPWKLPAYLGRFTAAAALSSVLFALSSDAWALGARLSWSWIAAGSFASVLGATWFVYLGQNIGRQGRLSHRSEQLARTRMVLFGTLLFGMLSLWLVVFAVAAAGVRAVPGELAVSWSGLPPEDLSLWRYAAFLAIVGVLGAALGGNLEEEAEIKAELIFDEET